MNNDLLGAPFSVGLVETELEAKNTISVTCSSCQKCKHATEEPQKVRSQDWKTEFRNEDI